MSRWLLDASAEEPDPRCAALAEGNAAQCQSILEKLKCNDDSNCYWKESFVESDIAWLIAGITCFSSIILSTWHIAKHLKHYTSPDVQRWTIRIIFIVPFYALISWLTIRLYKEHLYFEAIRDIYESFVIYCFLMLILGYCGGESSCLAAIREKPPMKHPWPFGYCLPRLKLNVRFIRWNKRLCLQFVIQKPIFAILSIIMESVGKYSDPGYQWTLNIVYNISYSLALYGLLLFYLAVKDVMREASPLKKFFAVKAIIFATFYQWTAITVIPFGQPENIMAMWNDFILSMEMPLFSVMLYYCFPWWEFRSSIDNIVHQSVVSSMREVFNFKDVASDISHNFKPTYQDYHMQTDQGPKTFKARTYLVGNVTPPEPDPSAGKEFKPEELELAERPRTMSYGESGIHTEHIDLEYDPPRLMGDQTEVIANRALLGDDGNAQTVVISDWV